jgi:predicted transcriptional regulator
MSDTVTLSFRVPASKAKALEKLAAAQDRPKSYLLEKALDGYLEDEKRFYQAVSEGVAEADADSPVVEHDRVMRWIESWATDKPLPRPKGKRRSK